jgi:hypothetical protein
VGAPAAWLPACLPACASIAGWMWSVGTVLPINQSISMGLLHPRNPDRPNPWPHPALPAPCPAPADMHRLRLDVQAADKERGRLEGRLAAKEREIGGLANKVLRAGSRDGHAAMGGGGDHGGWGAPLGCSVMHGSVAACRVVSGAAAAAMARTQAVQYQLRLAAAITAMLGPTVLLRLLPACPMLCCASVQAKALGEQHRDDLKAAKKEADELAKKVLYCGGAACACWESGWRWSCPPHAPA